MGYGGATFSGSLSAGQKVAFHISTSSPKPPKGGASYYVIIFLYSGPS